MSVVDARSFLRSTYELFRRNKVAVAALRQNHARIDNEAESVLRGAIQRLWFDTHPLRDMFDKAEIEKCWDALLFSRLATARDRYIPWLNEVPGISGLRILEIGCGSGPATLALLEQGGDVVGADVSEDHMELGKIRLGLYGFTRPKLINIIGDEFRSLRRGQFDLVIFMASLEHMHLDERIDLLRRADVLLRPQGYLAIVECPNRLWHSDLHTSFLPFHDWLPNDLAFRYGKYCDRSFLRGLGTSGTTTDYENFIREGRGASYHELQLAFGPDFGGYQVISSLGAYERRSNWLYNLKRRRIDIQFSKIIASLMPEMHWAFFEDSYLNVILCKPG